MDKTVLLIATFDTKGQEALYLKQCIEAQGVRVLVMDTGILGSPHTEECILREEVARRGGMTLEEAVSTGDKRLCTEIMCKGCERITREFYDQGRIQGVIGIGGAQGTEIACAAMRVLPTGVPRLMASTVANGPHQFGFYMGTKDLTIMHTVSDMQGLNFLTKRVPRKLGRRDLRDGQEFAARGHETPGHSCGDVHAGHHHARSFEGKSDSGKSRVRGGCLSPERHRGHRHGGHDS